MELRHVLGNTWVAEASTALLGIYKLNDKDIILLDTGIARQDREGLTALLEEQNLVPKGIICSHAHYDHTGNAAFLRQRYGAQIAAQIIEAGIGATAESYRANYIALTYDQCRVFFAEDCFPTDIIIGLTDDRLSLCGVDFRVLQLPGHAAGQIGVITPDNVAYLADSLVGPGVMASAKLPTAMFVAQDLENKLALHDLSCNAYILAHKDVLWDIHGIIEQNICFVQEKAADVLGCLENGMTLSQWLTAFSHWAGFRTHNPFKLSIIRRNFTNFVAYLEDSHRVAVRWDSCEKHYYAV